MRQLLTYTILLLAACTQLDAKTIYVDQFASGSITGGSWANAYRDLQTALYYATPGDTIYVAKGTYYPDEGLGQTNSNRFSTFALKNDVAIYGGYPRGGGSRDVQANPTILSGDLNQDDGGNFSNITDNALHIVTGNSLNSSAVLDGFTIKGGYASTGSFPHHRGAGLYLSSSPTIANCTITENSASYGAGAYIYNNAAPTLTNCAFIGNRAGVSSAGYGGGAQIVNINTSPTFTNCLFSGNYAEDQGGAVSIKQTSLNSKFTNCTFSGNSTDGTGGAIEATTGVIRLENTIIWNNRSNGSTTSTNATIYGSNATLYCNDSLLQNFSASTLNSYGSGNMNGTSSSNDPLFLSESGPANAPSSEGDYRLQQSSPVLNKGNSSYNSTSTDLAGNTRKIGSIDLGAYEGYVAPDISVRDLTPTTLVNNADYDLGIIKTGTETSFYFAIDNLSDAPLNDITLSTSGTHAAKISFTYTPGSSIEPRFTDSIIGKVNADFEGQLDATISILSNDPDENPFSLNLTATLASDQTDSDGDGLDDYSELAIHNTLPNNSDSDGDTVGDGAEVALASLGFSQASNDQNTADLIRTNASGLGMHSSNSLDLEGVPYITRNGDSFTLSFKIKKSTDLSNWSDLTLATHLKDSSSAGASMLFAMPADKGSFYRFYMEAPNSGVNSSPTSFPDADSDGVRDDTEQALQSLGFLDGQDDSALLELLQAQASGLSLYNDSQVQYLSLGQHTLSITSGSNLKLGYSIHHQETLSGANSALLDATSNFDLDTHEASLDFQSPNTNAQIYKIILK